MSAFVVDTNVAIVANGRDTHANESCQLRCIEKIESIINDGLLVVVDAEDLILEEYGNRLEFSREPGAGDEFFMHLVNYQYQEDRVQRVIITPSSDERRGFEELPPNELDPSDRKFLAVAKVSGALIVNATDSDWNEHRTLTESLGVAVEQLCPEYASK